MCLEQLLVPRSNSCYANDGTAAQSIANCALMLKGLVLKPVQKQVGCGRVACVYMKMQWFRYTIQAIVTQAGHIYRRLSM